jgi:hypothetical protein
MRVLKGLNVAAFGDLLLANCSINTNYFPETRFSKYLP